MASDETKDIIDGLFGDVADKVIKEAFKGTHKKPSIHIGKDASTDKELYLPIEEMAQTHTHIPGRSGVGKSKFMERMARDIIKNKYGLIVLDGKGDLYENLMHFCAYAGLADKTILIDPNEPDYSVGINYLELLGNVKSHVLAGTVLEGMKKFFNEEDLRQPWLEEWSPATFVPLIENGFTLLETFYFISQQNPSFRNAVLEDFSEKFYKDKWDELKGHKPHEQSLMLGSLRTRASRFWEIPVLKAMFGQQKTTVDWLKVMNEGGIVLVNLGKSDNLDEMASSFIGAVILHQVMTIAPARKQGERRPCFFMGDEFQRFITSDFSDAFDRMRGLGVSFVVAHQHRSHLEEKSDTILSAIDTNARNKFVFSVSAEDAEAYALELYDYDEKEIKDEVSQTKFRPVKTTEEIVTRTETETDNTSSIGMIGSIVDADGNVVRGVENIGTGSGSGRGSGVSRTTVPSYDYEEFQEVSSRTFTSPEEQKMRYTTWLKSQSNRCAYWKYENKKPLPIYTATMQEVKVIEPLLRKFKETIFTKYHKPTEELNKEIDARIKIFLEEKKATTIRQEDITGGEKRAKQPAEFKEDGKPPMA